MYIKAKELLAPTARAPIVYKMASSPSPPISTSMEPSGCEVMRGGSGGSDGRVALSGHRRMSGYGVSSVTCGSPSGPVAIQWPGSSEIGPTEHKGVRPPRVAGRRP